jgi:glycosyltransferase involved in cell wall biosynthesis
VLGHEARHGRGEHRSSDVAVAFNALPCAESSAGVSTYIRELLHELRPLLPGPMVAAVSREAVDDLPPGVQAVTRYPARGARRALQGLRDLREAEIFHGLDVDLPAFTKARTVSTVHDLAVYDVPWAFPYHRVVGERLLVSAAIRRADVVLAVSDFTAERLWDHFRVDAVVTPEAPGRGMHVPDVEHVERVRRRYRLPESFVLHIGTCEPRKNVDAVAEACHLADVRLVMAGPPGWKSKVPGVATMLGFVPAEDLPALYGAASASVYYSSYEGFGLPPLDSMACRCPVVSSPVPSVRQVPQGAVVVPSGQPERLAKALRELMNDGDRRRELGMAGQQAVDRLSWFHTARVTAQVYRELGAPVRSGV